MPKTKEKHLENKRRYYAKHREQLKEKSKQYYYQNQERLQRKAREFYRTQQGHLQQVKKLYGVSPEQYTMMLKEQFGKCRICSSLCKTGKRLCVDHNHATGQIRGLLCDSCNRGIGFFQDKVELLKQAATYLEKYNDQTNN